MENPFSLDLLKVHYIAKGLCIYIEKWHPLHPTAIYSWRLEMDGCDEFRASRKCWEISDKAERSQILPKMEISLANLLKQLLAIYLKWNATSWRLYIYIYIYIDWLEGSRLHKWGKRSKAINPSWRLTQKWQKPLYEWYKSTNG